MNDEATSEETSRISDTHALSMPGLALDAILRALSDLPVVATPAEITRKVVQALALVHPGARVGACIVHPRTQDSFVELSLPEGEPEPSRDPSRLFPAAAAESILPLEGLDGSTLHFAASTSTMDPGTTSLIELTARVLSRELRIAIEQEQSEPDSEGLKARLVQTEKFASFGRVVANVVHELANPLTSIIAYADHLRRGARARSADATEIQRIDRIGESAQRILSLSRDLISYARPANSQPEPIIVQDVIDRALSFCDHELSSRDVQIQRRYGAEVPPVRGAAGPLVQVFVNLFTNAAHAMAAGGGHLTVSTSAGEDPQQVEVTVSDTGTGMDPSILGRVFEPFFTTKESEMGSGLGLVIVKEIIVAHGGTIDAESELGRGTTFRLGLPTYQPPRSTRRPLKG